MQYKGLITVKRLGMQDMLVIPVEIVEVDDVAYNRLLSRDNAEVQQVRFEVNFTRGNDGELRATLTLLP